MDSQIKMIIGLIIIMIIAIACAMLVYSFYHKKSKQVYGQVRPVVSTNQVNYSIGEDINTNTNPLKVELQAIVDDYNHLDKNDPNYSFYQEAIIQRLVSLKNKIAQ